MRDAIRRLKDGVWYECRPAANGVFYAFWSEQRRSRRESMGTKEVGQASARFDEWLTLRGAAPRKTARIADLWAVKYGEANASFWKNLEPTFGGLLPRDVTQEIVNRYVAARVAGRVSAKGHKATPGSARQELVLLLAAINNGTKRRVNLTAPEDVPDVDLPDRPRARDRWLNDDEINALMGAASKERSNVHVQRREAEGGGSAEDGRLSRAERFIWIALDACARRTAIQELRWDTGQVDLERRVIDFNPPGRVPTKKRRAIVPMSDRLYLVLRRAYDEWTGPYVLDTTTNINRELAALAARAGVARVTPHVLRHTAATQMARRGVSLWTIAKLLGDTTATVESVYAKWQPDWGRDAVEMTGGTLALYVSPHTGDLVVNSSVGTMPSLRVIQGPQ
jgi:integrase